MYTMHTVLCNLYNLDIQESTLLEDKEDKDTPTRNSLHESACIAMCFPQMKRNPKNEGNLKYKDHLKIDVQAGTKLCQAQIKLISGRLFSLLVLVNLEQCLFKLLEWFIYRVFKKTLYTWHFYDFSINKHARRLSHIFFWKVEFIDLFRVQKHFCMILGRRDISK